jgi:hypothetical protein
MKTEINSGDFIAAGVASAILIAAIIFALRYDYRKRGIGDQFIICRVALGFLVLATFFFGLLALGWHLQTRWSSAGPLSVIIGFLAMVFGGFIYIKKTKKTKNEPKH